jgi:hypothetical protein
MIGLKSQENREAGWRNAVLRAPRAEAVAARPLEAEQKLVAAGRAGGIVQQAKMRAGFAYLASYVAGQLKLPDRKSLQIAHDPGPGAEPAGREKLGIGPNLDAKRRRAHETRNQSSKRRAMSGRNDEADHVNYSVSASVEHPAR